MGGGTSLIEAVRLNRKIVGIDLNPIATFVTKVKITKLSKAQINKIELWDIFLSQNLNYTLLDINYLSSSKCFILLFLNTVSGSDTKTILCIYVFFRRSKCTNTAIKCAFSVAHITMIKH